MAFIDRMELKIITGDSQIDRNFHQQLLNVEVVSFLVALKNSMKKNYFDEHDTDTSNTNRDG